MLKIFPQKIILKGKEKILGMKMKNLLKYSRIINLSSGFEQALGFLPP
jgi:hypothetical protein